MKISNVFPLYITFLVLLISFVIYNEYQDFYEKKELNYQIKSLQTELKEKHKFININISKDRKIIVLDYYNCKYDFIVEKMKEFEHMDLLMSISEAYGLDWKIFAVQIFYESTYDTNAKSNAGARGLMQLTRFVYGKDANPYNEIHNVFIGISYFHYLYNDIYKNIVNEDDKIKFTLAAYHDGITNINSYRKNIVDDGFNPNIYSNLEKYLSNTTITYVNNIFNAYNEIEEIKENKNKMILDSLFSCDINSIINIQ